MTLDESIKETEEFAKGYVQSTPKVTVEMVEGVRALPAVIKELPSTINEMGALIAEHGPLVVAEGIWDLTKESVKEVWNEDVINGTTRSRGEVAGRSAIAVADVVFAAKGLKDWLSNGKKIVSQTDEIVAGVKKVEDVLDETGDVSKGIKQASKVVDGADAIESGSTLNVPDSSRFPQTRSAVHDDLVNRGYKTTGTTDNGYVVYKHPNGNRVTIKPTGEVITTVRKPVDPSNTSPKAPKYNQRAYYDETIIPDELNDHTTGHFVGEISMDDFYPEPYKWEGEASWMGGFE